MEKMKDYRIVWEIDITAKSPREAARQALELVQEKDTTATVFDVFGKDESCCRVDLMEA